MNRTLTRKSALYTTQICLFLVAVFLISGCSKQNQGDTATNTSPQAVASPEEPIVADPSSSACDHLLWPLVETRSWQYTLDGPTGAEDITLDLVAADGQPGWRMAGATVSISCVADGINSLLPALVAHPELGRGLTGTNPRGALLPSPDQLLPLGTPVSWDFELDAQGTIQTGTNTTLTVEGGKLVFYRSVTGVTSTMVPAGTFSTLTVKEDAFLDIVADGQPLIVSTSSTHYYAEGVGLIRVEFGEGLVSGPQFSGTLSPGWSLSLIAPTP